VIRVTVELLPFGSEVNKKTLGVAHIANDATGSPDVGNYNVALTKFGGATTRGSWWRRGKVTGFKRVGACLLPGMVKAVEVADAEAAGVGGAP